MTFLTNTALRVIDNLSDMLTTVGITIITALIGFWALMAIADKLGIYSKFDRFMSNTPFAKRREYFEFRKAYFDEPRRRAREARERRFNNAWKDYQREKCGDRQFTPQDYLKNREMEREYYYQRKRRFIRERNYKRRQRYS